jgi:hypothetical protein
VREPSHQVPPLPLSVNSTSPIHIPTRDRLAKSKSGRRVEKTSPHDLASRRPVPYPRRSSLITPVFSPTEVPENHLPNVSNISTPPLANTLDCTMGSPFVSSPIATSPSADTFYNAYPNPVLPTSTSSTSVDYFTAAQGFREPSLQNTMYKTPSFNTATRSQSVSESTPSNPYYSDVSPMFSPPVSQVSGAEGALLSSLPQLSPRLLAAASMDGNVPFIFSEQKELETKAMLRAAGLQEIPLPQIVAASMSARAGHPLPPNLSYASPKLPLSNHATWLSSMPSSSVSPTAPSSQGSPHHSNFAAPQTHMSILDAATCSFEGDQVQNTVSGTSSLTRWNG